MLSMFFEMMAESLFPKAICLYQVGLIGNYMRSVFRGLELLICIPIIVFNFHYYQNGYSKLFKLKPNMDSLVALSTTAAFLYSLYVFVVNDFIYVYTLGNYLPYKHLYFDSVGMVLTLVSLGKYIETRSKAKTTKSIDMLMALAGDSARVIVNKEEIIKSIEDINIDDLIRINTGDKVPVDGIIIEGNAHFNESSITGESIPVFHQEKDKVISGTINLDGSIIIKATSTCKDSTLAQIINLVEQASTSKAPIARLADAVGGIFVPIVMGISILTFLGWLIFNHQFDIALEMGMSVLVISCPCALGLATPISLMISTGVAAKNHALVKSAAALEELSKTTCLVFDKTGTITEGKLNIEKVVSDDDSFASILKSLEFKSSHPIAQSIVNYYKDINLMEVKNYQTYPGRGVSGEINKITYYAGNVDFVNEHSVSKIEENINQTIVAVATKDKIIGYVLIADIIKVNSEKTINYFKKKGIHTVMLTGDNEVVGERIKIQSGVDECYSNLLPDKKADIIKKLQEHGYKVTMVGDGINDAIALQTADVGVAIGAGSDIALESSDIILARSDLMDAYNVFELSTKTFKNIKFNLFWAFIYNLIAIPIAAGALNFYPHYITLDPMISALCMTMSSVCVCLNSLRLLRFKGKEINNMKQTIYVEGMMCMHCVKHVNDALLTIEGIEKVDIDLKEGKVDITSSREITREELNATISVAGYKLK